MIKIYKFDYNSEDDLFSNTYVIQDEINNVVVIDPSMDDDRLLKFIQKNDFNLLAILLTHAHYDHIQGVKFLQKEFNVPIYLHENEIKTATNPKLNCSDFSHKEIIISGEFKTLKEKDVIHLLKGEEIEVIFTPFHTDGSACYFLRNSHKLFSGDTIFKRSVGRDDLKTSVPYKRKESIAKIKALPDDTLIYPGHGPNSVLKEEKALNVFFK